MSISQQISSTNVYDRNSTYDIYYCFRGSGGGSGLRPVPFDHTNRKNSISGIGLPTSRVDPGDTRIFRLVYPTDAWIVRWCEARSVYPGQQHVAA